ncbi:MAG: dihydroorotate dehydrogenase electron transfer subunit [bacterium]
MRHACRGRILENEHLRDGYYLVKLDAPAIAAKCAPGQFVLIRGTTPAWPYLRRPFSIYATDGEATIEIVYKVVGRATSVMAATSEGEYDLVGPLGTGFTAPRARRVIAVAGGAGLPPLVFYCQNYGGLVDKATLVIGARTAKELLHPVGLIADGVEIRPYTDDGTKGEKGSAVDGLEKALESLGDALGAPDGRSGVEIVGCGPRDMLRRVAAVSAERDLPCQVSVEEMMACGLGACLACAVPRFGGGYLHACTDGPVFEARAIDWSAWR